MVRVADEVVKIPGHRVPPQDLDAERSVLGSMLLSTEAMADVVEILEADDFYRQAHGKIYQALRTLFAQGEPIDIITAVDALRRTGILDDVGGALYLRDLVDEVPTPAGAPHYAKIVSDAALRRRLIGAAADIIDTAYVGASDADDIADGAEQRIYDVARREDNEDAAEIGDLITQAMSDHESIQNRESAYTGLPTGFRDLDDLTSGLQPGNLIIVAARPGIGKSSLAMNVARNVAVTGAPVAVFSLEMSRYEIGMRLLCGEARVPWDRIRNKRVGPDDWIRVVQAGETLHEAPLHIVDSGNVNIVDIRAKARRMRTGNQGLSLIIVDYLQLMTSPNARRPDSRQQEVAEISRNLKLLAKELHVPVVALSQLNRNPEARADKRPQLSDLRESGAIEQDSDVVMFIHRDDADPEKKKHAELIVAKHRNGPTDTIRLSFEPSLTQFRNAARDMGA
ncbi:MAG TPA: replicative DNA helicase [Actinomycetota bacterium]|nr:replicative DNA helicase [Actinomycetota bacterium]